MELTEYISTELKMSNKNKMLKEMKKSSSNQDTSHILASVNILNDFDTEIINKEDSILAECSRLQTDSNSETPDKYPNAPHTSPIDILNHKDSSDFNAELLKCLRKLPMIVLSSEERIRDGSSKFSELILESPIRSYLKSSTSVDSDITLGMQKEFQDYYENSDGTSKEAIKESSRSTVNGKNESTALTDVDYQLEKVNLLRVDSDYELNTDLSRRCTLSDMESMIVNCDSDASDISFDSEYESSRDVSRTTSTNRIEFEALAIDSPVLPSNAQRLHQWKMLGRSKRALSLDEISPSKLMHALDFSQIKFEFNI